MTKQELFARVAEIIAAIQRAKTLLSRLRPEAAHFKHSGELDQFKDDTLAVHSHLSEAVMHLEDYLFAGSLLDQADRLEGGGK